MLGRTDSRRRLLFLLAIFVVGSMALVARTAYWQIVRGAELTDRAVAQTTTTIEVPSHRGEIYDRTGTILLATTVERDRLVAAPRDLSEADLAKTEAELVRLLGLDATATAALHAKLHSGKAYVILARGIDTQPVRADPPRLRRQARRGAVAGVGARARLPAGRRRPGFDAGGPSAGLRQSRERRASTASSSTTRTCWPGRRAS